MPTPDSTIMEEPERFSERLDFSRIESAKDRQKEFLKQMEKRWNQKAGLQLWRHFVDKYELINEVYKAKYKKDLEREKVDQYFNQFKVKSKNYQKRIEVYRRKLMDRGVKVKRHDYSNLQVNFIKSKKDMPLYWLSSEFNKNFKTKLTRNAIRDKRLRILGRKV